MKKLSITSEMLVNATLQAIAGAVPFGNLLSAALSIRSDLQQDENNAFVQTMFSGLEQEFASLAQTLTEVNGRLDVCEKKVSKRISGKQFQSLFQKAFRRWSEVDSEQKRCQIRNILINSALRTEEDDERIKQYIDWILTLSSLEVKVMAIIADSGEAGLTRKSIWETLGHAEQPREVSRHADFFRLALRRLRDEQLIRIKKSIDEIGNLIPKEYETGDTESNQTFDDKVIFRLTNLGREYLDFVTEDIPELK